MKLNTSIIANSFLPASAVLELTYACNNKCLFCSCPWEYSKSGYKQDIELSGKEWKICIKNLVDKGVCNISYTGGEPFLNKNIYEIIEYTSSLKAKHINKDLETEEKPPNQFLISNGQLLDEDCLHFLKKHNIHLSLSLPGLKTYEYHTEAEDYTRILQLLSLSKEIGLQTTVNVTVTKKNISELYETISNAMIAGADLLLLNRFLPGGRGMSYVNNLSLSQDEVIKMLKVADEVLVKANRKGSTGTEIPICLLKDVKLENLKVGTRCSAAIDFFVVGPEGMIRTCNHSPKQLVHFSEIEKLIEHSYWKSFTQKDYLPVMCKDCSYTYCCDGGCREAAHIYNGKLKSSDPIFDEEARTKSN